MTFIIISGDENVGKTSVCNKLHDRIVADPSFTIHGKQNAPYTSGLDFIAYYEKNQKHIVMNTSSDTDRRMMEEFANYLDGLAQNGTHPDIIITTIRENNNVGYLMSRMLALLDAFANSTPNLENYYKQNIKSITSFAPKNLTRHAFVLHLEEQKNKNDAALNQYWDYNADTAKQMLDLAVDRL